MAEHNGNGGRRNGWTGPLVTVGLAALAAAITYGATSGGTAAKVEALSDRVSGQDVRLQEVERTYIRERDLSAISNPINQRLNRIEVQLDRLNENFRRPQP